MSLRQNFDSFTAQHKLRDAQEEFTEAVYRFRAAEEANAGNLITLKRENCRDILKTKSINQPVTASE